MNWNKIFIKFGLISAQICLILLTYCLFEILRNITVT